MVLHKKKLFANVGQVAAAAALKTIITPKTVTFIGSTTTTAAAAATKCGMKLDATRCLSYSLSVVLLTKINK